MFACDCHELHDRTRWVQYVRIVALYGHACPYFRRERVSRAEVIGHLFDDR
jgi:hypothetical protein